MILTKSFKSTVFSLYPEVKKAINKTCLSYDWLKNYVGRETKWKIKPMFIVTIPGRWGNIYFPLNTFLNFKIAYNKYNLDNQRKSFKFFLISYLPLCSIFLRSIWMLEEHRMPQIQRVLLLEGLQRWCRWTSLPQLSHTQPLWQAFLSYWKTCSESGRDEAHSSFIFKRAPSSTQ